MKKEYPRIDVSVDAVVFGYKAGKGISVLLIRRGRKPFKGSWALPGGYVEADESLDHAAARELKEETGIELNDLEQLYTFGNPRRHPVKRVISVAYYTLVKQDSYKAKASDDATATKWFSIEKLPDLAFDHKEILEMAIFRLRNKISCEPVGFGLFDNEFSFSELHQLYETLHGKKIAKSGFKKKFLRLGILEKQEEKGAKKKKRYRFDKDSYFRLKKQGIVFEI